jgi:hypothetical protein
VAPALTSGCAVIQAEPHGSLYTRRLIASNELSRLTGTSYDDAFHSLAASLSEPDLDRLVEEFIQLACGDDMAARDEIMRLAAIEAAGTDGSQREAAATE